MASQNSAGIQTLLEAEKEASKIVQKARQYRVERLKDARKEAEKEISALRAQKVAEYAKFEKEFSGSTDATTIKVNQETEARLTQTKKEFEEGKAAVMEKLVKAVITVKPRLHENARPAKAAH